MASFAPGLANFAAEAPVVSTIVRSFLGIAPQRELPRVAGEPFQRWAIKQNFPGAVPIPEDRLQKGPKRSVVLWADTFNNYFHPETARAAMTVLQDAGFEVLVPREHLCCGRPLYDFGMLDRAKSSLQDILTALAPWIEAGMPFIVLEPSCASVFRDELRSFFAGEPRAEKLRAQTILFSEFLERHAPHYHPPKLAGTVLLHGHCHQKALMKMTHAEAMLKKMGLEVHSPDSGCCGMAGPFGFEKEKYAVSQAIGERVLLPAVRETSPDTLVVADGFSCREQIFQATGRWPLHFAELIQLAKQKSGS
jgi:Fe-S oxidoreductase